VKTDMDINVRCKTIRLWDTLLGGNK